MYSANLALRNLTDEDEKSLRILIDSNCEQRIVKEFAEKITGRREKAKSIYNLKQNFKQKQLNPFDTLLKEIDRDNEEGYRCRVALNLNNELTVLYIQSPEMVVLRNTI